MTTPQEIYIKHLPVKINFVIVSKATYSSCFQSNVAVYSVQQIIMSTAHLIAIQQKDVLKLLFDKTSFKAPQLLFFHLKML